MAHNLEHFQEGLARARKSSVQASDQLEPMLTPMSFSGALSESPAAAAASVIDMRAARFPRAFEMLAAQPLTLVEMTPAQRDSVVVTAIADDQGIELPLSRFGDRVWDMAPEIAAKNLKASNVKVVWPDDVPKAFVDDAKAALYCALRRGPRGRKWSGSFVAEAGRRAALVLRHFATLGLDNFSQVRALHLSDYIAELRRQIEPGTVMWRLMIIDVVWSFHMEVLHPLPENPWAGLTVSDACGCNDDHGGPAGRAGKTPVIPRSVQYKIFAHCEARLVEAEDLFRARDAGEIGAHNSALVAVRDVVLYLLQITSGMRNSESTGVTSACWRTEVRNGTTFHWVRTREIKTTGGKEVDFLVPPEALRALEILQCYARPLQARLADEARWLEGLLGLRRNATGKLANGLLIADAVKRLNHVREIGRHLVLGVSATADDHLGNGSRVEVQSLAACGKQLRRLAKLAGTDWALANHQCRRTFAFNVANSRLGRMGLVFLKWQLKHASLSWTQLYAASPYQDHALYREFEDELFEARLGLLEDWIHPNAPLTGGAGKKIMQTRAKAARDLGQLLRLTAESADLRSTGHAWCITGTRDCHGQGIYDSSMCGSCSQAVISKEQAPAWQMIHLDNLRLAVITDCGPAVAEKGRRAVERSAQVLQDLGVPLPTAEQACAYAAAQVRA